MFLIVDIARQKNPVEPKDVVKNWLRSKNTLEYLGLWEQLNNPHFKGGCVKTLLFLKNHKALTFTSQGFAMSKSCCNFRP